MLSIIEKIVFLLMLALTFYAFFTPIIRKVKYVKLGTAIDRFDNPVKRILHAVKSFFLLLCSVKKERPFTGFIHIFILYGSLTFDTITGMHILEGLIDGVHISNLHAFIADCFAVMVLFAASYFLIRRYVMRPDTYTYKNFESLWIYLLLITVTLTFLLYEGAVIANNPAHSQYSFFGKVFAGFFPNASMDLVKLFWWIHIINVFIFIAYVPRSKYLHMIAGPVNIALRNNDYLGKMKILDIEDEEAEYFGVEKITHMNQKDLMDGFACIECGRCQDYCPAYNSGKTLSPKEIIVDMRDELMEAGPKLLKNAETELQPLAERVYKLDDIWDCTTCGACMQVCPVENEQVPKIIGIRQSQVLMESKFPEEFNVLYKGLENQGNPWGINAQSGMDWAADLNIPLISEKKETDVLVFSGCMAKFDANAQKNQKFFVDILNKAGIDYAFLGNEETCCGDPSRRTGREELFQMHAMENIDAMNQYQFKRIVTTCPHCLHVLKNEYSQLGGSFDVIDYSDLILEILRDGKVKVQQKTDKTLTYHDPCYLGRYNKGFESPRTLLKNASGGNLEEMKNNREHSFCCGAGGGGMWKEEDRGDRINHVRFKEAESTGADVLVTGCPFCSTMLKDAKQETESDKLIVKDIAEVVAESLK